MNHSRESDDRSDLDLLLLLLVGDWSDLGRHVLERASRLATSTRAVAAPGQPFEPHAAWDAAGSDGRIETFRAEETIWEGSA